MNSTDAMYGTSPKRLQMPLCDKVISAELSNDYTLPDYQPEIRRILKVMPSILPPAKYIGGNNIELNGTIDYNILYVGADGGIYSTPLSAEYALTAPLEITSDFDLNEGVTVLCDMRDENITARVSAPRKIGIKCRILARIRAYGMMIVEERCVGEIDPMSIERLMGDTVTTRTLSAIGDIIELCEEIPTSTTDIRVVSASANANIPDVTLSNGYADCRGELILKLIISKEGVAGDVETLTRSVAFEHRLESDDISADGFCKASADINDISVSVEDGRIVCSVSLIPQISAYNSTPMSYTKDIYSTDCYSETAYRDYTLPCVCGVTRGNFSQSERRPISETSLDHSARIIDIWCRPSAEKFEFEKNKCIISGQCKYTLLVESNGEFSTSELTLPFRYEGDKATSDTNSLSSEVGVLSCRARIDGGSLCIDTELYMCIEHLCETSISTLSEVRFGESVKRSDGDVIVYFPSQDDTPWSVAKKYFVPASKISAMANYIVVNK